MARARTLLQLRTRIRELADCMPDANARHSTDTLNVWINESWQALREMVAAKGDLTYVENVDVSTGVGPDTGKAYGLLALPATAVRVHAIDLTYSSTDIRELLPVSLNQRNEFLRRRSSNVDTPTHFSVFSIGKEAGATVGNGWIAILPAPDRVYPVTIYYVPAWTDITNDAHVFNGHAGWDDWVACDVVLKCAMKDNDMAATAQLAMQMKAEAETRVFASCATYQRVGPVGPIDTARKDRMTRRWRLWGDE